ncbi:hypothetical protein [Halpernia humi]|uniref:hypothetical protein n=1 Tax=Halpernia humi TaxID=493375 RepID=UPI0011B0DE3B|nr:hypothetical protein [Halpernia humi]
MLFSSIYIFAFLIASNIHKHNAGYFYKDFNFKNSTAKISAQSTINNSDDCLSCHFASAPILLPPSFAVTLSDFNFTELKITEANYRISKISLFHRHLRGPPQFI